MEFVNARLGSWSAICAQLLSVVRVKSIMEMGLFSVLSAIRHISRLLLSMEFVLVLTDIL